MSNLVAFAPLALLGLVLQPSPTPAAGRVVPRAEILAAMRAIQGYDPAATTNGARFQAEVLLYLVRASQAKDKQAGHLFVDHADWYYAWLERLGLEEKAVPAFMRLAYEHAQDLEIDARPGSVLESVLSGPAPQLAANVRIGWPAAKGGTKSYSYDDTLAIPDLHVTNDRVIVYRLLDYGDMIVFDEIEGLHGRPTEGVLGLLFDLIGEGSVRSNRMAVAPDGIQVARARATKGPFHVESTITVFPDGRVEKGVPQTRPDLAALEKRLLEPRRLRYLRLDPRLAPGEVGTQAPGGP